MARLGTDCSECRFYQDRDCVYGILDKFRLNGDNVIETEDSHVIDRVCVYRRTKEWRADLDDNDSASVLDDEVYIRGSIIIVLKKLDNLRQIIEVLQKPQYDKFSFVIAYDKLKYKDIQVILDEYNLKNRVVFVKLFIDINEPAVLDEAFKWAKNGYTFFIDADLPFDENMVDKVNHAVNKNMQRVMCVRPLAGKYHQLACFSIMFAHLKGNKFIEKDVLFVDKLEALPNASIYNWEDLDNAYTG